MANKFTVWTTSPEAFRKIEIEDERKGEALASDLTGKGYIATTDVTQHQGRKLVTRPVIIFLHNVVAIH